MNSSDLVHYLKQHIGDRIFLNANDQKPYVLESVERDYIRLAQTKNHVRSSIETFVVPLTAIVSVQKIDGVPGVI
ncbi:MAG: hypothetical protein Q9P90_09055, partial [candidate division KSB1 bacterium]|nr:hypothetical protein [candidate division KSB1 bacterium]